MTLNKVLRLVRSLAVLDFETTGLNPDVDRVCQMGITIHYVDRDPIAWSSFINPEIPILNTANHSITDADVKDAPTFRMVAPALAPRIIDVDIAGYNVSFDIKFMRAEMKRAEVDWPWDGHIIDPLQIYKLKHGHNLTNAYKEYVNVKGFEGAHDAGHDVDAVTQVLIGQLGRHQDLPRTVKELADFCFPHPVNSIDKAGKFVWCGEDAAINFGKHRGKLLKNLNKYYLNWIIDNDFADDVKDICEDALNGVYPTK